MIAHKNKVVGQLQGGIKQLLDRQRREAVHRHRLVQGPQHDLHCGHTATAHREPQTGAKKVIIATGSTSAMPGFLPKHERVVESRGFLDLTKLPGSMLVLGGGFIGCELACMAAMLGVKVTIVELLEDILLLLDADVRREVRAHMEKDLGIRVLTGKALGEDHRRRQWRAPAIAATKSSRPTCCSVPSAASRSPRA